LVVTGTAAQPKTMLLFYDNGVNYVQPETAIRPNDTSLLRSLSELRDAQCPTGRTVLQTVAHEDDDILFMNPDLLQGVKQGDCIRTIYFTAGDAGTDQAYWLGREEGAKAGYAYLLDDDKPEWRSRDVQLSEHHQVKIARLQSKQNRVSLVFVRLPDGNVNGNGFASDHMQSLQKLAKGVIPSIHSIDDTSEYTREEILAALVQIMEHYSPAVVRTQGLHNIGNTVADHSDHLMVGQLTEEAFGRYKANRFEASIQHYVGYTVRERPANVTGDDLLFKKLIFFTYSQHDASTCLSDNACEKTSYKYFLDRQYTE